MSCSMWNMVRRVYIMVKISVCIGSACHLKGSYNVINGLQQAAEKNGVTDKVSINGTFCTGNCGSKGVAVIVDEEYFGVDPTKVKDFFNEVVMNKI